MNPAIVPCTDPVEATSHLVMSDTSNRELWLYHKCRGLDKGQGQGYHGQGRIDKSLHRLRRHVEDKRLGYHRGVQSHRAMDVTGTTIGQIPNCL